MKINWDGFRWIVVHDENHNVLAYERISFDNYRLIVVLNFSFCDWNDYIIYVEDGEYEIIMCSNDKKYGGRNELEGKIIHAQNEKLKLNLPYSCGIILRKVKK